MTKFEDYIPILKQHKFLLLAIIIIILVLGAISSLFIGGMYMGAKTSEYYAPGYGNLPSAIYETPYERQVTEKAGEILSESTEYKIKRGSTNIKSIDATSDYEKIRQKTESFNGWVETMNKNEDYRQISIIANLKIPSDNFDSFADWLIHTFDVKNANLEFYRVSVEKQQDEIQILLQALDIYNRLLDRTEKMDVSEDNIELIMKITQKKLDVMRLLNQYGYSVEQVERESNYSSLSVTLTQEKKIKLMPEELEAEFRTRLRNSVRDIINAGMDLVTVPIVIFVKIIVWIIYAIIVLIPIFIAYKLLLKFYKVVNKKI